MRVLEFQQTKLSSNANLITRLLTYITLSLKRISNHSYPTSVYDLSMGNDIVRLLSLLFSDEIVIKILCIAFLFIDTLFFVDKIQIDTHCSP
jgi:hypothetical protein